MQRQSPATDAASTRQPIPPLGFCPYCDYPINPGRCSECGKHVEKPSLRGPTQRRFRRRVCVGFVAAALSAGLLVAYIYRAPIGAALIPARYAAQHSLGSSWLATYLREVRDVQLADYNAFENGGIDQVRKRIQFELAHGFVPEWAGDYVLPGDDFGEGLRISPNGEFTWHSFSNGGRCANHGTVSYVSEDRMDLVLHYDATAFQTGPNQRFHRCTWNERDYLVPAGAMPWFLNQINDHGRVGLVLERDARIPAAGDHFPVGYERYVHMHPLTCRITQVGTPAENPEGRGTVYRVRVECNAGDFQNVFVGMKLHNVGRPGNYGTATVTYVHKTSCIAEYSEYCDPDEAFQTPQSGWQLSSSDGSFAPNSSLEDK